MNEPARRTVTISKHAHMRLRQRGLSEILVPAIMQYGCRYHVGRGRVGYVYGKLAAERARRENPLAPPSLNVALVVASGNLIVTAFHFFHHIPRHWRAAN